MLWTTRIILIVGHEDGVLEILRIALESMDYTDYVLLQARTADAALATFSRLKSDIDLAIVDLDLPNDDGLVISLLKICARRETTKLIVKTSRPDKPFLEQVNDADAIVLKPLSEDELTKTIQAALRAAHTNPGLTATVAATNGGAGQTFRRLWRNSSG